MNTNLQTFRMVEVAKIQNITVQWKERKRKERSWATNAITINIRGSVLLMDGDPRVVELCIASVGATKLSIGRCDHVKALRIMCPLIGEKNVVLASCPSMRSIVAQVGSEGARTLRFGPRTNRGPRNGVVERNGLESI